MNTRVYKYGCLPPTQNAELVREQIFLAHRYRNTLVEVERGRRAALRELDRSCADICSLEQAVADADNAVEAALDEVKGARKATRDRSDTGPMRERVRLAKEIRKTASAALRDARRALRDDSRVLGERDRINDLAKELRKGARALCGVYWGTYQLIEAADEDARAAPLYDGKEPNDPSFQRFDRQGQVSVQLMGGHPSEKVFDVDTRVIIAPVDERAWYSGSRSERRRLSRTELRLRVGSDDKRGPVWAVFPMLMHRPLPKGSVLMRATVSVRRHGLREEWSTELTVRVPEVCPSTGATGAVALDLGWRAMGNDLRVGMLVGTDGLEEELTLNPTLLGAINKANEIRSLRDEKFNTARDRLSENLKKIELPEWLEKATKSLGQWRSPDRLASLAMRWRKNRFSSDESAYTSLEEWRYRDQHLLAWESGARRSSLRARKDGYRCVGARLAMKYETLVLEDFDLSKMAKRPSAEKATPENETARSNRVIAATSELRLALINAFEARGGKVCKVPAADTTRACNECGHVCNFDQAATVHNACSCCGVVWDQDQNASKNLLERWSAVTIAAPARDVEMPMPIKGLAKSKWIKAKEMAAEKTARIEALAKRAVSA